MTEHILERQTFRTSRLLDFCSERELVKQIGHASDLWPLVVLKEGIDNGLDAAEEINTAPVIRIEGSNGDIVIAHNGPGIPADTIPAIPHFTFRLPSPHPYATPPRGPRPTHP